MSQLEKLKAQLAKQKRKKGDIKVVKVEKEKRVVPPPTSVEKIEKTTRDDENLRKGLSDIMNNKYDIEKVIEFFSKQAIIRENPHTEDVGYILQIWDKLDKQSKQDFAIQAIPGYKKESGIIKKLIALPLELRNDFIKQYINQKLPYDKFYAYWSNLELIKEKIELSQLSSDKIDEDDIEKMRLELYNRALAYANRKNIVISDKIISKQGDDIVRKDSYIYILKKIRPKGFEKIHKKIAKDYIEIATSLGAKNAEDMTVIDLLTFISKEKEKLISLVPTDVLGKLKKISHEKRIIEASKLNILNPEDLSHEVLFINLLQANKSKDTEKTKKDLLSEAEVLGIKNPDNYDRPSLVARIENARWKNYRNEKRIRKVSKEQTDLWTKVQKTYDKTYHPTTIDTGDSWREIQKDFTDNQLDEFKEKLKEVGDRISQQQSPPPPPEVGVKRKRTDLSRQIKTIKEDQEQIEKILSQTIDERTISIAKKKLSSELLRISEKTKTYKVNSPYVNISVDQIITKNQTVKDLFKLIANFVIYLHLKKANIFRKRIKAEYYIPDILLQLSPEDKLPEIFDPLSDVSDKTKEVYSSYINNYINNIVYNMIRSSDPTSQKVSKSELGILEPEIKYNDSVCIGIKNVKPENIVYYRDPDDSKIYCLDIDNLFINFSQDNFTNPITGKLFSNEFTRRFIITYNDFEFNTNFNFPYIDIKTHIKSGNILNPKTGRPFSTSFIDAINKGTTFLLNRQFIRLDRRVASCKNSIDVLNENVENIVYYKDPSDNSIYCFSINNLEKILANDSINPHTKRKFSKAFIDRFNKMFKLKQTDDVFKDIQEEQEKLVQKEHVIIPNLWELVSENIFHDGEEIKENTPMSFNNSEDEEYKDDETDEQNEQDEDDVDDETDDVDDEQDEQNEDDETDDVDNEQNKQEEEDDEASTKKEKIKFKHNKNKKCEECKKNISDTQIRTIIMKNMDPNVIYFCCLKCMEKYKFPKFKK